MQKCVRKTSEQYRALPSPPYDPQRCQGQRKVGNDGNIWESRPCFKWVKVNSTDKTTSKDWYKTTLTFTVENKAISLPFDDRGFIEGGRIIPYKYSKPDLEVIKEWYNEGMSLIQEWHINWGWVWKDFTVPKNIKYSVIVTSAKTVITFVIKHKRMPKLAMEKGIQNFVYYMHDVDGWGTQNPEITTRKTDRVDYERGNITYIASTVKLG